MILGITGGVGFGKSTVLNILEKKYNAYIVQADMVADDLMQPGALCYESIVNHFGIGILDENGYIDKKLLGNYTFANSSELEYLSSLIHPSVRIEIEERIRNIHKENKDALIAIEAALLIEAGYQEMCDSMWYVKSDYEIRKKRLSDSRGYTDKKIDDIISNQLTEEEFEMNCDVIINNNGNIEDTISQINLALEFSS